jgi:serine/threonine protein kinase
MNRDDEIFAEALELPPAERVAFLARACADDAQRARIESLLAGHAAAEDFLERPAVPRATPPPEEQAGDVIGHYTLLRKVGEGGCGVVWLAEQTEPVRRRVALKVIKLGMDTRNVIARFEAERQALAMMDHPDIARVFDAGATDRGSPYFIMELVRGVQITKYCDQNRLDLRQRLELLIQTCHAIQHAHQKGIIHGDIKPSNIMVAVHDGQPVPKVIDFGIAKATESRLTRGLSRRSWQRRR